MSVRVTGQLEHPPPVHLVVFLQPLRVAGEADERREDARLVAQLLRQRLREAVASEVVGEALRPVLAAPDGLALLVVTGALVDARARERLRVLPAAGMVGVEVRDDDAGDRGVELGQHRLPALRGIRQPEPGVDQRPAVRPGSR